MIFMPIVKRSKNEQRKYYALKRVFIMMIILRDW